MDEINGIDLFCGAGGFSNGFENAGVNIKFGVDVDEKALKTFRKNHNAKRINHDIRDDIPRNILERN